MALSINDNRKAADMANKVTVDRRLWLTTDGKLVEDGDPKAAFLWAGEGREVRADEAERLGYKPKKGGKSAGPQSNTDAGGEDTGKREADASGDSDTSGDQTADPLACDVDGCDFVAKNAGGLKRHRRSHA